MKHLETRIHAANQRAQEAGARQAFTTEGLKNLGTKDVEKQLGRLEKAGLDKGKIEQISKQTRDFEKQGPKMPGRNAGFNNLEEREGMERHGRDAKNRKAMVGI